MSNTTSRVAIQCDNVTECQKFLDALKVFDDHVVFSSGIRANTREPYPNGVHVTLFYLFSNETEEGTND